jgi:hypothetical protein
VHIIPKIQKGAVKMKKLNVVKAGIAMTLINAVLCAVGFVYLMQSQTL